MNTDTQMFELARDIATAPDRLEELAKSQNKKIRQLVCQNPSTPQKVLVELAAEFPSDFGCNPSVDKLANEKSELLKAMDENVLAQILTEPKASSGLISWAMKFQFSGSYRSLPHDTLFRLALSANPIISSEVLSKLAKDEDDRVALAAKLHKKFNKDRKGVESTEAQFSATVKSELGKLRASEVVDWKTLFGLPHLEFIDWPARVALSGRSVLATFSSPDVSSETLGELVRRPSWRSDIDVEAEDHSLREVVVANPSTPQDIVEDLKASNIPDDEQEMVDGVRTGRIYQSIVRHFSADQIQEIIEGDDEWKKRRLSDSADCPADMLPTLLAETNHERFATLDVSNDLLQKLASSGRPVIRAGAAHHPGCPSELRKCILSELVQEFIEHGSHEIGVMAASNPYCTKEALVELAKPDAWVVLACVAVHPNCPSALRKKLDKRLRKLLADVDSLNPGVIHFPSAAFQAMFKTNWLRDLIEMGDPAEYNMHTIATHPNWPWDDNEVISHRVFLAYFARWGVSECIWGDDYLGDWFLVPLIKYAIADNLEGTGSWGPCNVLAKMARSPNATPDWLIELAKESNRNKFEVQVRDNLTIAIAVNHPKFPKEALAELADGEALCQAPRTSKYWEKEFARLSEDGRRTIANNDPLWIHADQKSLRRFDEMPEVLKWICIASGKAPLKHIQSAAKSVFWEYRAAAAKSGKISMGTLSKLAKDPNMVVADCAQAELIRRTTNGATTDVTN